MNMSCKDCDHHCVCKIVDAAGEIHGDARVCKCFSHPDYISNAQKCLNNLCDEILGENWYTADAVSVNQVNRIIAYEIVQKYKAVPRLIRRLFGG